MIFEIIKDISTFMIILFVAVIAYAQISMIDGQADVSDIGEFLKDSYALTLGDLGEFDEHSTTQFIVFIIFSFFVTILLMNMVIAIMSDSYERVMANATPADCRLLASMLLEMEQIVHFISLRFKGELI
jgi:hypothetical protein